MNNPPARPRMLGSTVLVLLLAAAALIPARALAEPPEGGEGSGTPLIVTPAPIVVPTTTVGHNGQALEVEIANPGEDVAIEKVMIEGPDAGEFFANGSSCGYLGEGQKCQFIFGLKPASVGLKQATMVVTFQGGRAAESFAVSGEAVEPQLAFTPASHDFGLQRINRETVSTSFQLTNTGAAAVQLNNLEIQGDNSVFWVGNNNCWSGGPINPGNSCYVEVNFNPHERTAYSAELRAVVNSSAFTATLSGSGGRAVVETPQNPVIFSPATVGGQGEVRTIVLANSGELSAAFFISVIAGGDAGSFELLDENCTAAELMPMSTCAAHVRFTPQGPGLATARLAFFGDGDDGMMVFLQGEGFAAAATLLPGAHDFGAQVAGGKSAARSFLVRNEGQTGLDLDRVELAGNDLDQFALAGDECSGSTLAPGGECLVRVRFAPDSAGAKTAKLRVRGDGGVLASALSGEGEEAPAAEPSDPAAASTFTVITETRTAWLRKKRRFARGHGIVATNVQPLRRGELRASAARR